MSKNLVIVESPAKAKTIGRYLGKEFVIAASVGHIRDLPSSSMGVDVRRDFKPTYINMRGKEKVIRELKDMADKASQVYIATDPDREGEAIAWHIAGILKIDPEKACRISFNEITQKAVVSAIENPRNIDIDLVNAQQARRILDRLVGYELSPLLWKKIRKGLSAGRVQSVATKMIVDREAEINAFQKEEYWLLTSELTPIDKHFPFKSKYLGLIHADKIERVKLKDKQQTQKVIDELKNKEYSVYNVKKGKKSTHPSAPFTTSTLQQEASRRLSYSSRKTMSVAQQLYEGIELSGYGQVALVSYIRTDSVRVSADAVEAAAAIIEEKYGKDYLPKTPRKFNNKNASQDAHEAIRPTHFELSPESIQYALSSDQYRLYKMIWDRFIASQMASAQLNTLTLDIQCADHIFRTQGETVIFKGYLAQYEEIEDDTDLKEDHEGTKAKLPMLEKGDVLKELSLVPEQKFTQPPPRYTEASLIKAMEEKGIGRPSTYAPTISTILERLYVEKQNKYLYPTELGEIVTKMISENFDQIVDYKFTATMEESLDDVELGKRNWIEVLRAFYEPFHDQVEKAGKEVAKIEMQVTMTGDKCPECQQGDLLIKEGRYGRFVACSNFPECKYTKNLETPVAVKCPICGSGLVALKSRKFKGRIFYTCDKKGSDSNCPFISWDLPIDGKSCPECQSYMVQKVFRGRKYEKCANKDCVTNKRSKSKAENKDTDLKTDGSVLLDQISDATPSEAETKND
ncbi:MAG: type I DNA topoisomerase [Clostridiaceae bacterium]|mgnify:CR=1 FL=1|nr:type I DNA topoisomerase [Clostridiaceae bacterium]